MMARMPRINVEGWGAPHSFRNSAGIPSFVRWVAHDGPVIDEVGRAVTHSGIRPPENDPIDEKLQRMEEFGSGWHFGEGSPMRPEAMHCARQLHKFGKAFNLVADVFPHEDGDVSIMFKADNQYLEVLCMPDMKFSLTLEEGAEHPFRLVKENEEATLSDVFTELFTFVKPESLCHFFDSFTLTNIAAVSDDLHRTAFAILRNMQTEPHYWKTNVGLVSLIPIAYGNAPHHDPSVNIFEPDTETPTWSGFRFSTG